MINAFLENFDKFADAPNVPGNLRKMVLELAVQGKLVDRDPQEGDASKLLDQIRENRKLQSPGAQSADEASQLHKLPTHWVRCTLGDVTEIVRGVSFPGSVKSDQLLQGSVACLRTASVQAEIDWTDLIFVPEEYVSRDDQWIAPNDIMISMANSYELVGKVAIVRELPQRATFGAFLAAIRPVIVEPYFLLYVLRSPRMQAAFRSSSSQTTNIANISLGRMRPLPFPIPPLAEQKRIVAKVDELMAVCDRLEAQQRERVSRHTVLARASLGRFSDAPTTANLSFLFHEEYTIDPAGLRKAVRSLAVQGKLIPQDPNDEPAEELLGRIAQERDRIVRDEGVRLPKKVSPVAFETCPYSLPESWQWARLGQLAVLIDYGTSEKADSDAANVPVYRMGNIVGGRLIDENLKYVDPNTDGLPGLYLKTDDILFNRTNSYELVGKTAIFKGRDDAATFASYLIRLRFPASVICPDFVNVAMNAPYFRETQVEPEITQQCGQANFNGTKLGSTLVPLPPLAEQRRIIAKTEELLSLIDTLEAQIAKCCTAGASLMEAFVSELVTQD